MVETQLAEYATLALLFAFALDQTKFLIDK